MDIRQLETFIAIADEGGFTRAAARLHLVQSAVSATLKGLEAELGHPLIDRSPRRAALTAEGEALLEPARRVLESMAALRDAAGRLDGVVRGSLVVGIPAAPDVFDLAGLFSAFAVEHPAVALSARSSPAGSQGLLADLVADRLDMSIVVLPVEMPPSIEFDVLAGGGLHLAVPVGHPLAGRARVSPAELVAHPFVDFAPGFSNRIAVDAEFVRLGLSRDTRIEAPSTELAAAYIAAGAGIGFLPRLGPRLGAAVEFVPVAGMAARWTAALAFKRGRRRGTAFELLRDGILARGAMMRAAGFDPSA